MYLSDTIFTKDSSISRASGNIKDSNSSGLSLQPPLLQLKANGSGNEEYDEFLDGINQKENLKSKLFSGNEVLEKAYDNKKIIRQGSVGSHISKLKRLLVDLGFLSEEGNSNEFDGNMKSALQSFQDYYDTILEDGIIGPETMRYLDEKAEFFERDFGECEPEDREEQISDVEEEFEKEKKVEDDKWFWEDKSEVPAMALGMLKLYRKYVDGENVNDLYIPTNLSRLKFSLLLYIKQEGLLEEVTKDLDGNKMKNRFYHPIEEIEESLFEKLDKATNSEDLLKKVRELVLDTNRAIATIIQYSSGFLGHFSTTGPLLKKYLDKRLNNKNDIYSVFQDTWF